MQRAKPALIRLGKAPKNDLGSELSSPVMGGTRFENGSDGLIVFHGGILDEILQTRIILGDLGIYPIIHSCFDFQVENINEILSCHSNIPIMIVEEHMLAGGLGTMFLEVANEVSHVGSIKRVGISKINKNIVGSQSFLRQHYGLDATSIANSYMKLLGCK